METQRWTALLSTIVPQVADDLDGIAGCYDPRRSEPGRDVFPQISAVLLPHAALKRSDAVCVGIRVSAVLSDAADYAMRLAAFAAERNVEIIVLAEADATGLERFGLRVERIAGDGAEARARCEQQIRRFWNIDLVL
ncbi:MAG: hypothetical protein H0T41_04180 [Rhodobacteraceae bacterium]|nr:hypothetical protein [Paracoccaceae bacterium]